LTSISTKERPLCFVSTYSLVVYRFSGGMDSIDLSDEDGFYLYNIDSQTYSPLPNFGCPVLPTVSDISGHHVLLTKYVDLDDGYRYDYAVINVVTGVIKEIELPSAGQDVTGAAIQESRVVNGPCFYPNNADVLSYVVQYSLEGSFRTSTILTLYNLRTGAAAHLLLDSSVAVRGFNWNHDGTGFASYDHIVYLNMELIENLESGRQ